MAGLILLRRARQAVFWSTVAGFLGSVVGLAYLRYLCSKHLYVKRQVTFWWRMAPIVLHYRWAARAAGSDEEREERINKLHARYAPVVARKIIGELRGMFTKVAQVASISPGNILPGEYKREFQRLQNDVPEAAWLSIRGVIEEELGAPIGQLFERFERKALGCASIGQAHLATWRGRAVVLKVQYPEAAANLRADFDCLERVARMNIRDKEGFAVKMTQKIRKQFEKELDYQQEAWHLRALHDSINAAPEFFGKVMVPAPIPELTRGRVLGMDYVPGPKLADIFIARLRAVGMDALANTLRGVMEALGESAPDMSDSVAKESAGADKGAEASGGSAGVANANVAGAGVDDAGEQAVGADRTPPMAEAGTAFLQKTANGKGGDMPAVHRTFLVLSRFLGARCAMVMVAVFSELRLRWLRCRGRLAPGSSTSELKEKLQLMLHLQGYQLFFCPVFNGDPHPGNFLAVPDGRIGLIDLGQCVQFDPKVKLGFANLIVALNLPETEESNILVADILMSIGVKCGRNDKVYLSFIARFLLTAYRPEWMQAGYTQHMMSRDSVVSQPIEVLFITRISGLLKGFGLFLAENVDLARAWAPWAERWLRENGESTVPAPVKPDHK